MLEGDLRATPTPLDLLYYELESTIDEAETSP